MILCNEDGRVSVDDQSRVGGNILVADARMPPLEIVGVAFKVDARPRDIARDSQIRVRRARIEDRARSGMGRPDGKQREERSCA